MAVGTARVVRVIVAHNASYADPIAVAAGDALILTGRADIWEGHRWLWAVAPDGREGWVPDTLPVIPDGTARAERDYSARELDCAEGAQLEALAATHGWTLCRDAAGATGWVPDRCLAAL